MTCLVAPTTIWDDANQKRGWRPMFDRKTVFILGAGASYDLNLPIGETLKDHIRGALVVDRASPAGFQNMRIREAVIEAIGRGNQFDTRGQLNDYIRAAEQIRAGMPAAPSIDNYINTHKHDPHTVRLAKLAIAECILAAEAKSYLEKSSGYDIRALVEPSFGKPFWDLGDYPNELLKSWYIPFLQLITADIDRDHVLEIFSNLAFIVFNYDRCTEHFLYHAIRTYYRLSDDEAAEILNSVEFVHPYGQVGYLEWQRRSSLARFGGEGAQLLDIADNLQTFTETLASGVTDRVRGLIAEADTVVVMGFGFLRQNMELITPPSTNGVRRAFMTTFGMSDGDAQLAKAWLLDSFNRADPQGASIGLGDTKFANFYVERGDCLKLMLNNRLGLSRAS
jgi:hypothetical protein